MRRRMAAVLWTPCFLLAACEPRRVVEHIPTPPERLVCEGVPAERPAIPPERALPSGGLDTASVRAREAVVGGYLLEIERRLHGCAVNAQWRREFEEGLARE